MVDLHKKEHAFGAFTIGVAVGVGAALLFGTEDGRKLAKKILDNLPEKIKNLKDVSGDNNSPAPSLQSNPYDLSSTPEATPHTAIYSDPSVLGSNNSKPFSF